MPTLHELAEAGQSAWLDFLSREYLASGELKLLIGQGVRGVTDNPTILDKAISGSTDYDQDIVRLARQGRSREEIYEALALCDVGCAADLFLPTYERLQGADGFVSLEVSPLIADDTAQTIAQAQHLFNQLQRPNIFIKVPATPAGIPAIQTLVRRGLNINITLIFAVEVYRQVVEAYLSGLEERLAAGERITSIASVASFFVSRVDTAVDKALQEKGPTDLPGKIAIANAKVAYEYFETVLHSERWRKLAAAGAHAQRPLWASTSTKNPAYPDTMYIDQLIGSQTVNTMPPETLHAFLDHGHIAPTLRADVAEAHRQLIQLAELGIDLTAITDQLTRDGVDLFSKSYHNLLDGIERKRAAAIGKAA